MEDKQPASSDLTEPAVDPAGPESVVEDAAVESDETTAEVTTDPAEESAEVTESASDSEAVAESAVEADADVDPHLEAEPNPEAEPIADAAEPSRAASWFSRQRANLLIGIPVALFVAAGVFAGAVAQPYLADRAAVATKLDIARTAASAITTLWTYTPDDMDKLPDRSAKYLSGGFEDQYRKFVDAIGPSNKQAKVTNSTQVVGAAVESLRGDEATAIVYTNTSSTSPMSKNIPSIQYLSYRLELKRHGGQWQVTKMTTVTSLDLTPKL